MTISNKMKISSAAIVIMALTITAGCGGSGGGGASGGSGAFPSGIYVTSYDESIIKHFTNMSGTQESDVSLPAGSRPACFTFDKQGKLIVGITGGIRLYHSLSPSDWTVFGTQGSGVGQFQKVTGLVVDSAGHIYIADTGNKRIVRIDDISGAGWASFDVSAHVVPGEDWIALELDSDGYLYLAANQTGKILRFDSMTDATPDSFGSKGAGFQQFENPFDIHIGKDHRFYVSDIGIGRIVRFDDFTGKNWTTYGTAGAGIGNFDSPAGIATDSGGRIYISDQVNHRIIRINDMTGAGWTTFGSYGTGVGQFKDNVDILVR